MRTTFLILSLFYSMEVVAQPELINYELGATDTYVLEVKFVDSLLCKLNPCKTGKDKVYSVLHKIKIKNVIYCPKNSLFDSGSLSKLEYIILPIQYNDSIKKGGTFIVTSMPSTSKRYISLTKILHIDSFKGYYFFHRYAYLSGLIGCKKKTKDYFDKYIISKDL